MSIHTLTSTTTTLNLRLILFLFITHALSHICTLLHKLSVYHILKLTHTQSYRHALSHAHSHTHTLSLCLSHVPALSHISPSVCFAVIGFQTLFQGFSDAHRMQHPVFSRAKRISTQTCQLNSSKCF